MILPPDKDWAMKQVQDMPPSNFSRRMLAKLGISENIDQAFLDIEKEHDLEIEAQAFRIYLINHQAKYQESVEAAILSWEQIDQSEKDYYRRSIEKILSLADDQEMADNIFSHLASEIAFNRSSLGLLENRDH